MLIEARQGRQAIGVINDARRELEQLDKQDEELDMELDQLCVLSHLVLGPSSNWIKCKITPVQSASILQQHRLPNEPFTCRTTAFVRIELVFCSSLEHLASVTFRLLCECAETRRQFDDIQPSGRVLIDVDIPVYDLPSSMLVWLEMKFQMDGVGYTHRVKVGDRRFDVIDYIMPCLELKQEDCLEQVQYYSSNQQVRDGIFIDRNAMQHDVSPIEFELVNPEYSKPRLLSMVFAGHRRDVLEKMIVGVDEASFQTPMGCETVQVSIESLEHDTYRLNVRCQDEETRQSVHAALDQRLSHLDSMPELLDVPMQQLYPSSDDESFHSVQHIEDADGELRIDLSERTLSQGEPAPITLSWDRVSYSIRVGRGKKAENKKLLHEVTGIAKPGEIVAIMGASGAGKSTLLNVLAGRIGPGTLQGKVLINDAPRSPATWKNLIGYVEQDDLMYQNLTVRETLTYAALLRLPYSMSRQEKEARVDEIINDLSLTKCQNTIIGDSETRGVSGGERKRVSIGIELVTRPRLLFADEPTSGLDAFTASTIIQSLRSIAVKWNRTVLLTIHQPREYILTLFDKIILLSDGHVVYSGGVQGAVEHFENCGFPCPPNTNPSDFFLDTMTIDLRSDELKEKSLVRVAKLKEAWCEPSLDIKPIASSEPTGRKVRNNPILFEFGVLLRRNINDVLRDAMTIGATVGQSIVNMIILGVVFWKMDLSYSGIQNRIGSLFFVAIQLAFGNVMPTIAVFTLQKQIIKRERAAGTYRASSAYIAKILSQLPLVIFATLLFGIPVYWMIGLQNKASNFAYFLLITVVHAVSSTLLGIAISSGSPNVTVGQIVGPMLIVTTLIFGGQLVNLDTVTVVLRWLKWVSGIYYAYVALANNEMNGLVFGCQNSSIPLSKCNVTGEAIVETFNLDDLRHWQYAIWINALLGVGAAIIGYFLFVRQSRPLMKLK